MRSLPLTGWDPAGYRQPFGFSTVGNANAFFVVRTPEGELCCTRQGSFTLDGNRRMVTTSGCAVLGLSGGQLVEIYLPGGDLQVNGSGLLTGAINNQGEVVERLALVEIPAGHALQKICNSLYRRRDSGRGHPGL